MQAKHVLTAFDGCMSYLYPSITNINIYEFCQGTCWIMFQLFSPTLPKEGHLVVVIFFLDISSQGG